MKKVSPAVKALQLKCDTLYSDWKATEQLLQNELNKSELPIARKKYEGKCFVSASSSVDEKTYTYIHSLFSREIGMGYMISIVKGICTMEYNDSIYLDEVGREISELQFNEVFYAFLAYINKIFKVKFTARPGRFDPLRIKKLKTKTL